jgi:hypothetical protein
MGCKQECGQQQAQGTKVLISGREMLETMGMRVMMSLRGIPYDLNIRRFLG